MTPEIELPALEGTDYKATVNREKAGGYTVTVTRPFTDAEKRVFHQVVGYLEPGEQEVIGAGTLPRNALPHHLNRLVEEIVNTDTPSLTGIYTATPKESE